MNRSAPLARLLQGVVYLLSLLPIAATAGTEPAGNMTGLRQGHVAVGLADGRALVAGGSLSTAETYDPATATFTATGLMSTNRLYAASARLADGRVLVAGGTAASNLATAEIYDPVSGTWSATGSMAATRTGAVAITLASGQVLVIAGDTTARACELYDPATGVFTPTGLLGTARVRSAATLLADGRVLVAGGQPTSGSLYHSSAEIWDPATGTWSPTGSMAAARSGGSATLLGDGRVLLAGGITTNDTRSAVAVAELYDPAAGTFSATGTMVLKRSRHTASVMGDGNVLVAGGLSGVNSSDTAAIEIYDTVLGTWRTAGSMIQRRNLHAAAALADGDVLITGGSAPANTAEVVDSACTATLASITPASALFPLEGGSGSVSITHTAGCAWRVLGSADWITFTSPTMGFGGGTVTYNVALNNSTLGRGSNLTIADSNYNVSQAANPCANASLSPTSQSFSYAGGSNSTSLSVDANCTWTVSGVPAWISIMSGATGSTGIPYTVAANPGGARSATLSIANRNLAVSQTANPCVPAPTITPASRTFPFGGGTNTVAITAPFSCPWTVVGAPPWISMSAYSGSGNNTLTVTASANTGLERTTTFTVAGNPFTVTQAANACADATISPTSVSLPNGSGTGTIELIAAAACTWSVSFIPSWITFTSGASGTGSATLAYSYAANPSGARSVTMVIAGRSFALSQAAAVCFPASTISPSSVTASATGGIDRSVSVTASVGCPWTVSSVPSWVTLTSAASGTGNGTVTYSIAANPGTARSATMVIAGRNHAINQSVAGFASSPTGRLLAPRATHVAVSLADGRALILGGITASGYANVTATSEIYDPATGTFSATGAMIEGRTEHAAVRLADGRVLAVGGTRSPGIVVATAEIYDPSTGVWSATGSMSAPRRWPMVVALADGRALVAAGEFGGSALATAEIFDPVTGTFTPTGSLLTARLQGAVVALPDGRVLALGGTTTTAAIASSEIWSPATGAWTPGGNMTVARSDYPFATVLSDGRVLVVAGYAPFGADNTAEIYDPSTGVFTRTGSLHYAHTLDPIGVTLADGTVFLLGGDTGRNVERYRPATQTWQVVGQLSDDRILWTATALGNGKVLAAGGFAGPLSSAEVFDPAVCSFSGGLSSGFQPFSGTGGSASITVTLTPGCPRTISTDLPSWITITGGGAGSGSGTVTYSVAANGTGAERSAMFSIAGAPHLVTQAAGPPPPPPSYCNSKGNTSSWEWIQQVTVAGTVRSSGNNAGYANFTSNPAIALARGANTIALQAGGGYSESWRVWIDFNRDSVFSDSEIVYTGSGAGTLSSSITVPASALAGNTRMRISMKYGSSPTACETFTYGEVEDYTVSIP